MEVCTRPVVLRGIDMNPNPVQLFLLMPALMLLVVGCVVGSQPVDTPTLVVPRATLTVTPMTTSAPKATATAMPDFELPDISGSLVSLSTLLSQNKFVVLVFYRGHF